MLRKKNQKQLLNKIIHSIILGLFFIGLSFSHAEENIGSTQPQASEAQPTPQATPAIVPDTEAPKTAPQNKPEQSAPEDEIDQELIKQQKDLEKQYDMLYKAGPKTKDNSEPLFDHEAAIKSMAQIMNKDIKPQELKKMKIHEAVSLALKPIQVLSEEEIVTQLRENIKGTKSERYLNHFPKMTLLAVKIIKDQNALPNASKVLENRDRLIKFIAVMICTILVGFLLKRIISSKNPNLFVIFGFFLARAFIMFCLRVGVVIFFFSDDLGALYEVVVRNL